MLAVTPTLDLDLRDLEFTMIRAQGSGGQNVNKVSSSIHLRFDIGNSSLPDPVKDALRSLSDHRISKDGVIVVKAQSFRSQEKNRQEAIERLTSLVQKAAAAPLNRTVPPNPVKPRNAVACSAKPCMAK